MRSVKCRVWSVKCGVWSVQCRVRSVESEGGVWSVKCKIRVWSAKYKVLRVERGGVGCKVWSAKLRS